jgi:hypothetical protein
MQVGTLGGRHGGRSFPQAINTVVAALCAPRGPRCVEKLRVDLHLRHPDVDIRQTASRATLCNICTSADRTTHIVNALPVTSAISPEALAKPHECNCSSRRTRTVGREGSKQLRRRASRDEQVRTAHMLLAAHAIRLRQFSRGNSVATRGEYRWRTLKRQPICPPTTSRAAARQRSVLEQFSLRNTYAHGALHLKSSIAATG